MTVLLHSPLYSVKQVSNHDHSCFCVWIYQGLLFVVEILSPPSCQGVLCSASFRIRERLVIVSALLRTIWDQQTSTYRSLQSKILQECWVSFIHSCDFVVDHCGACLTTTGIDSCCWGLMWEWTGSEREKKKMKDRLLFSSLHYA